MACSYNGVVPHRENVFVYRPGALSQTCGRIQKAGACLLEQPDTSYSKLRAPELDLLPRSTYTCCTHVITGTGMLNSKFAVMITPGEKQTERNQRQMQMSPRLICKVSTLKSKDIASWAGTRPQSQPLWGRGRRHVSLRSAWATWGTPLPRLKVCTEI